MFVTREEVKVYTPEEGKALKITKNGQVIMYMINPYYEVPTYDYQVEEINKEDVPQFKPNAYFKEFVEKMKMLHTKQVKK